MGVIEHGKTLFMQRCSQCHTVEIDNKLQTYLPRSASEPTSECKSMQFFAYKYIDADKGDENSLSTSDSLKKYSQLPKKYVPEQFHIRDVLRVFVYLDSSERIVSTTLEPYATVKSFAYLKCTKTRIYFFCYQPCHKTNVSYKNRCDIFLQRMSSRVVLGSADGIRKRIWWQTSFCNNQTLHPVSTTNE